MIKLPFVKYHGAGNDFVLMDFYHATPSLDLPSLARYVCDRRQGIGADGLLLLLPSAIADFKMRIFNADGSEPSMCGNGIRCLTSYILKYKNISSEIKIETLHAVLRCREFENEVAVNLGVPEIRHWPIEIEGANVHVVDTGVPHAVIFVDELSAIAVDEWGKRIRFHPHFAPHGVNVNFVAITQNGSLALRTYERGVEAETMSCGTGAAASAFVAMKVMNLAPPISVETLSSFGPTPIAYQERMRFLFPENTDGSIEMIGHTKEVFQGVINWPH